VWRGLDFELDQKFSLRIVATDGFYTDYANVSVTIIDVNGRAYFYTLIPPATNHYTNATHVFFEIGFMGKESPSAFLPLLVAAWDYF